MQLSTCGMLSSLLGVLTLVATVVAVPSRTSPASAIQWEACPPKTPPGVQCGNFTVPLDYSNPHGATINVAVARANSRAAKPKGAIFVNPGGPGGLGTRLAIIVVELQGSVPNQLLDEYDVIGIDPRGVGFSTPIKCDPNLWNERIVTSVSSEEEYNTLVAHNKAVGESCRKLTGPLFDHLDTVNVARDFDTVRRALGEDKFNYVGFSYGTQIGYTYAEMFPEAVGRMVLDGLIDHSQAATDAVQTVATTLEATIYQFFDWCAANSTCALYGQDARAFYTNLTAAAQKSPLPAPGCQQTGASACQPNVTYEDLMYTIQDHLIVVDGSRSGQLGWADLSEALLEASKGNATALSNTYYTGETDITGGWAYLAVGCQDWVTTAKSAVDIEEVAYATTALAPVTKGFTQAFYYLGACDGWPAPVTNPQRKIERSIAKAPPILLVNAFWDPETSIEWAVGVKQQIPNSHLIMRNGSGHTSYGLSGDTAKAINGFLLKGEMPKDGTVYTS